MKHATIAIILASLAGCSSLQGQLENRIACTAAKDKLFAISLYGPVGITSSIADADRAIVCGAGK